VNGFLCKPGQWFDALEHIYLDKVDRKKMCEAAKEQLEKQYYGVSFVKQIEDAYNFFLDKGATDEQETEIAGG
jgi:DNA-dependent RNA polymerase auxiliary subunit epsilon